MGYRTLELLFYFLRREESSNTYLAQYSLLLTHNSLRHDERALIFLVAFDKVCFVRAQKTVKRIILLPSRNASLLNIKEAAADLCLDSDFALELIIGSPFTICVTE